MPPRGARSPASDVAGAAMISSASSCISRSSSDMRAWATSQPVRCIATASAAMLSLTSACAARIRGAHASQASMCSSKSFSNRSPSAISAASVAVIDTRHCVDVVGGLEVKLGQNV